MFKPNKWIAGVLGLVFQWFGLLYVAKLKWALVYFAAGLLVGVVQIVWLFYRPEMEPVSWVVGLILPIICAIHAFLIAAQHQGINHRPWYSRWYGLVSILAGLYLSVFLFRAFFYEPFRIPAGSMLPTLRVGAITVVEKSGFGHYASFGITVLKTPPTKELHRGDVIAFQYPEDTSVVFMKRVIGMPGDTVEYANKRLTINGKAIYSEVVSESDMFEIVEERLDKQVYRVQNHKLRPSHGVAFSVPENHYFMMGDNRDDSRDSRYWGFLPEENIVGRVIYLIEPPATGSNDTPRY